VYQLTSGTGGDVAQNEVGKYHYMALMRQGFLLFLIPARQITYLLAESCCKLTGTILVVSSLCAYMDVCTVGWMRSFL
jgi:hypothetical protein